jgi:hypothetical protein
MAVWQQEIKSKRKARHEDKTQKDRSKAGCDRGFRRRAAIDLMRLFDRFGHHGL